MKINECEEIQLSEYVDYGNFDSDKIFLICTPEYSDYHTNINPLMVLKDKFYKIKENPNTIMYGANFRERGSDKRELLTQRFLPNELFKVSVIVENQRNPTELPFFAFGDKTIKLAHEVHESFSGIFDLEHDYFIPTQTEIYTLLKEKNELGQSSYFYVNTDDLIFGPFNFNGTDGDKIKLIAIHNNNGYIYEWETDKIKSQFVDFDTKSQTGVTLNRRLVSDWLPIEKGRKIKFLPNDELLKFVINNAEKLKDFTTHELNTFKNVLNAFSGSDFLDIDRSIYQRAQNLFVTTTNNKDLLEKFLSNIPETEFIQTKISESKALKASLSNEISELENKKNDFDQKINEIQEEENHLKQNLEEIKNEYENLRKEKIEAEMETARIQNEELNALLREKETIQNEIQKIEKYENLTELDKDIQDKEAELRILKRNETELKDIMTGLRQEFISTQRDANEKLKDLIKTKTHFDFISGREFANETTNEVNIEFETDPSTYYDIDLTSSDGTDYISTERMMLDNVNKSLKESGREFSSAYIANVLISIHQNTFTIFAGLPGTGKTSLARLISKILVGEHKKRIEISVAKGWTSQKDFIGFYNPLSKSFCTTDPNMYQLLKIANQEYQEKKFQDSTMGYVILDEANLSPIEHYWSSFYNLTDSISNPDNPLTINLGEDFSLHYSNNIRFIGTINSDQTTEELSPRIIDRVNIIRIPVSSNPTSFSIHNFEPSAINNIGLTYKDVIRMFKLKDFNENFVDQIDTFSQRESYKDIQDKYQNLKRKFKKLNINISHRIDNAFIVYCMAAFSFMNPYRALDFFVAQRILTKIDGQGDQFREDLNELNHEISTIFSEQKLDDSESNNILDKIIHFGSNEGLYDNYNYFLIN